MLDSLEWLWWNEGLFEYGHANAASSLQYGCLNLNFGNVEKNVDSFSAEYGCHPADKDTKGDVVWAG
jgi:hypothetical protein